MDELLFCYDCSRSTNSGSRCPRLAASDCAVERRSASLRAVQRAGSPAQESRPHLLPFRGPEERTCRTPRSQETHAAGHGYRPGHSLREQRTEIIAATELQLTPALNRGRFFLT